MPHRYDHRDSSQPKIPSGEPDRLVVIGFQDETTAFDLRDALCELEEQGVIEVGDAVVATRNPKGKVRLHQSIPLISGRAALGAFSGLLMGMLLLNPLFGVVAGAAAGAASGALGDVGIDDVFMKSLGQTLTPGTSALFVVVRKTKPDELIERLKPFAGRCKVLQSTMSPENEAILRGLLEGAFSQAHATETQP
jgi:uncharacterized membrane protein